jgi:UPF0755 protein
VSDLLDLRSDPPPRGRPRRRRLGPLVVLVLVAALVLGVVLGGRAVLDSFRSPEVADFAGEGTGEVVVQIEPNSTASEIAQTLEAKGVVKSARAFTLAAVEDPDSRRLQPGTYTLRQQMSGASALALLLDPDSRLRGRVVVPEGLTVVQILKRVADSTDIPLAELQAAARTTSALGLPAYAKGLEGFLFPATYEIEPGTTAVQALSMMVTRFKAAAESTGLETKAAELGRTPYEIVIVASLIEREVRFDDELPKVAQVVYNRLEQNERLDIDAAVLYGLGRTSGGLRQSELDRETPYNLRKIKGLPPTPIANPGEATIKAALNPTGGDILFYVLSTKEGRSTFTTTLADHNRAVAKAKREGIF